MEAQTSFAPEATKDHGAAGGCVTRPTSDDFPARTGKPGFPEPPPHGRPPPRPSPHHGSTRVNSGATGRGRTAPVFNITPSLLHLCPFYEDFRTVEPRDPVGASARSA
ncbi:hypothetical protein GCM10017673_08080 [Streptosporangium violaceochromogenes]|nr:hypothetical protein GCM10017673_08080 [Streptosporangium violaceochromogenes]